MRYLFIFNTIYIYIEITKITKGTKVLEISYIYILIKS